MPERPTTKETHRMKILIPSALLLSFWLVLLVILFAPAPPDSTGFAHPRHAALADAKDVPAMNQGGDGLKRHGHILWPGWLLAAVLVAVLTDMLPFGVHSTGGSKQKIIAFGLGPSPTKRFL